MDMGDAGHILLSAEIARTLLTIDPWPRYLTDLGVVRVKHKQEVHLYNLYGRLDGPFCGNAALPSKVRQDGRARRREGRIPLSARLQPYRRLLVSCIALLSLAGGGWAVWKKNPVGVKTAVASLEKRFEPALHPDKYKRSKPTKSKKIATANRDRRTSSHAVAALTPGETSERLSVPGLRKLSLEEATSLAESQGFQVRERGPRVVKAGFEEGTVFFQSVPAGKRTKPGRSRLCPSRRLAGGEGRGGGDADGRRPRRP